jgi:hypothetical protein
MTAADLRLDYFQIYEVGTKVAAGNVLVRGQFDSRRVKMHLLVLDHFATPVSKNGEPIHDRHAHFAWYSGVQPPEPKRAVRVENQFGTFRICIASGQGLLVPTQKIEEGSQYPDALDHYKVYRLVEVDIVQKTRANLRDQFGPSRVRLLAPLYFAVPVEKRHDTKEFTVQNDRAHLLLFAIKTVDVEETTKVNIWNQFDKRKSIDVLRSVMLAVPGVKKDWKLA